MHIIKRNGEVGFDRFMPIYNWFFPLENEFINNNFQSTFDVFKTIENRDFQSRALYFHIPYCSSICTFCSFVRKKLVNDYELDLYIAALIKEIELKSYYQKVTEIPIKAIFFGGGTPSILKPKQIQLIGDAIKNAFDLSLLEEFSFELSPLDIDENKLEAMKNIGVTHVRFGVQTFSPFYRDCFNLKSTTEQIFSAAEILKSKFKFVSCDMLYGLNGQSFEDFIFDLEQVVSLKLTNIAFYPINNIVTQNCLHEKYRLNNKKAVSGLTKHIMNITLRQFMYSNGYLPHNGHEYVKVSRSEIDRNPVITNEYSFIYHEHVYGYSFQDVLGFGPNAISSLYDYTLINTDSINRYINDLKHGKLNIKIGKHYPNIDESKGIILRLPYHGFAEKKMINMELIDSSTIQSLNSLINSGFVKETENNFELTMLGWQWYVNLFYFLSPPQEKNVLNDYINSKIKHREIENCHNPITFDENY